MAYTQLEYFLRGNPPNIYFTYSYDMYRSGADVLIKFKTDVSAVVSPAWFNGYLNQLITVDGVAVDSRTIKAQGVNTWNAFSVETGWITLSNKTSGNLSILIRSTTNDTDFQQTLDKNYSVAVPPAAATIFSFPNFNIGSGFTFNISNPAGFYISLDFIAASTTVEQVEGAGIDGGIGVGIDANTLYALTPNSNTLQVTAQLKTWTNSSKTTQVGSTQTANANALVAPGSSNPVFGDFTFADIAAAIRSKTGTVTLTIANPCVVTLNNHNIANGTPVKFTTTGALPTGITANTAYYAKSTGANTLNLYDTAAHAIAGGTTGRVTTSGTQSGTHTITYALTDSNQGIISGFSNIRATVSVANKAVAQNYATMVKYRLTIRAKTVDVNYSSSQDVLLDLSAVDDSVITLTAIDSRDNSTTVTKNAAFIKALTNIVIKTLKVERDNSIDETVKLNATGTVHPLNFGAVTNSLKVKSYRYKSTASETWINGTSSITASVDGSGNITISNAAIIGDTATGFTKTKSYNVELNFEDELTTAVLICEIAGQPAFIFCKDTATDKIIIAAGGVPTIAEGLQSFIGIFNGSGGRIIGNTDGTCDTAAATAAKVVTTTSGGFELVSGALATIKFTNSVPANATVNIDSTDDISLYNNGSAIKAGVISAGAKALIEYNGTQYDLISIDTSNTEYGSTANGYYEKRADGTLICRHRISLGTLAYTSDAGNQTFVPNPYTAAIAYWTFPVAFVGANPIVIPGIEGDLGGGNLFGISLTGANCLTYNCRSNGSVNMNVLFIAIGRWKV